MSRIVQYFFFILYFLQIGLNNLLVDANPLIGDKVSLAQDNEFPFVVSLGYPPADTVKHHFCTGTLITKRNVLTAAHCVEVSFLDPSKVVVTVGSNDVTQGTKYKVQKWKTFEKWTTEKNITINRAANLFHDVAVVTLVDYVTENIKPAQLSKLNPKSLYGETVVAAGWGRKYLNIKPRLLHRADLRVVSRKVCLRNLKATIDKEYNVLNFICTVARPTVTLGCGDSGGPIILKGNEIVGVMVADCAQHLNPNQQNLHAAVKFYRKFIMETIDSRCALQRSH